MSEAYTLLFGNYGVKDRIQGTSEPLESSSIFPCHMSKARLWQGSLSCCVTWCCCQGLRCPKPSVPNNKVRLTICLLIDTAKFPPSCQISKIGYDIKESRISLTRWIQLLQSCFTLRIMEQSLFNHDFYVIGQYHINNKYSASKTCFSIHEHCSMSTSSPSLSCTIYKHIFIVRLEIKL